MSETAKEFVERMDRELHGLYPDDHKRLCALALRGAETQDEIERLRAALEFYANPHSRTDQDGDPILVPDFYDELSFGDTARSALHPAPIQKEEKHADQG